MRDVQCKRCIEYKGNWCDKKRDDPDPDMVRDCHWFRTKTNADRIRAMTDEELAREINRRTDCEPWACPVFNGCLRHKSAGECQRKILDWLKQEVEE